eukprot:s700_g10.t1
MRARDTQDAVIRVVRHCSQVKQLMKDNTASLRNLRQGNDQLVCFGGIQLFVDLEKAFDVAPRAAIQKAMTKLGAAPAIISLFSAWHDATSYVLQHHDMEEIQQTTRGVRQGCVAAPTLWTCLMFLLMLQYAECVTLPWLLDHLTIFADDIHLCQLVRDATDVQQAIDFFGKFFDCALDLGLVINFKKTEAMLRLAGVHHNHVQARHILRTDQGVFLCVPYGTGKVAHIPLKAEVTYLGVQISYQNYQQATLSHRIAAGRHIFQRLKLWLSKSSRIPLFKRFQLWHATVFSAMTYGIFTTSFVHVGLQQMQAEIMRQLRVIAGNFSQITAMTHSEFLLHCSLPAPAQLLLKRLEGMMIRYNARPSQLAVDDIVLQIRWDHLDTLHNLLRQAMANDPTKQALYSALHPTELHFCHFCHRALAQCVLSLCTSAENMRIP